MKIVIAPEYASLRNVINDIVAGRYTAEHVYCDSRNKVERLVLPDGSRVVVKRYKRPNIINSVVYGTLRKSKARRAYEYGMQLPQKGISTPQPIAYAEQRHCGRLTYSWFISAYDDSTPFSEYYATLRRQAADGNKDAERQIPLLRQALIDFVCMLEDKHVIPGDFNHDNIMVQENTLPSSLSASQDNVWDDRWHFALVDINRMHINKKPSLHSTMKMFSQFCRSHQDGIDFISVYAPKKGLDYEQCMAVFVEMCNRLERRRQRKKIAHKVLHS